jgi:murein DD-endopeptidase MepM/ murein hydrolase activator NlpD
MISRSFRRGRHPSVPLYAALAAALVTTGAVAARTGSGPAGTDEPLPTLPAVTAVPVSVDTSLIGGYARGSFAEALPVLASDLSPAEREMVGRHLDKIYLPLLRERGLEGGGRLRVAYERTRRPDGTTRSIQVLAAEAAVGGEMHTVFLFERAGGPGYFDDLGRSLEREAAPWTTPLEVMRVTSPFNTARLHPILHRVLPHKGLDLAAATGTPVRATADGTISHAGVRGGYGNLVEVQHPNGYSTRYGHLARIASWLHGGSAVRQGDVIGYVGATGLATGPHLHYEIRRKGQPVDPALVQAGDGPVRDVFGDPTWRAQKRTLSGLLSRAPTVVRAVALR